MRKLGDGTLDFRGIVGVERIQRHAQSRCRRLESGKLTGHAGRGQIPQDRGALDVGCDLLKELQPLPAHAVLELHEAGRVAARPR